ncbi:hypothetical protein CCUS01_15950, partial [Colletotrichum cuscutae]
GREKYSRGSREIVRWVSSGWRCPASRQFAHPPSPFISTWISREGALQFLLPFLPSIQMRGGFRHSAATRVSGRLISNAWFFLAIVHSLGSTLRAWRAPALCVHDAKGTASLSSERATWCELVGISVH